MPRWKFWGNKAKEEKPKATSTCNCEICRFSSEVDKAFLDKEVRELLSPFVTFPSTAISLDPEEKVKEGKNYESQGEISKARESYRGAVIAAIAKDDYDVQNYCEIFIKFAEKHEGLSNLNLESYRMLKRNPEIAHSLRKVYQNFLEQEKTRVKEKK